MRIRVVIPNSGMSKSTLEARAEMLSQAAGPGTVVEAVCISKGPTSIESFYDVELAAPEILTQVSEASCQGADAVIVYCFADPAIEAAREISPIPVIGPGQASLLAAAGLSSKFSIVTTTPKIIPLIEALIQRSGINPARVASIRSIGVSVAGLARNDQRIYRLLVEEGGKAISKDGAQTVVLGCLSLAGLGGSLGKKLGVPVIDPSYLAVRAAEMMVHLRLSHGQLSFGGLDPRYRGAPPERNHLEC